jgi:hypothetical protein
MSSLSTFPQREVLPSPPYLQLGRRWLSSIYQKWHIVQEEEDYKVLPWHANPRELSAFIETQLKYFGFNWSVLDRQEDLTKCIDIDHIVSIDEVLHSPSRQQSWTLVVNVTVLPAY